MLRLSLIFRDKTLSRHVVDQCPFIIGSASQAQVHIDSLAIAPRHVLIDHQESGYHIKQEDPAFPVWVNEVPVQEATIRHGDSIRIGKHLLLVEEGDFSTHEAITSTETPPPVYSRLPSASLQVLSGRDLGRVVALDRPKLKIGKPEYGFGLISKEIDAYYLWRLTEEATVRLNGVSLNTTPLPLGDGAIIEVGALKVQFFLAQEEQSMTEDTERRRFHRILFDARALLRTTEQTYNTSILDISLNGALLRLPETWNIPTSTQVEVIVLLDDKHQIRMTGHLVHQDEDTLGIQCTQIDMDSIGHLRRLVELNTGNSDILKREFEHLGH